MVALEERLGLFSNLERERTFAEYLSIFSAQGIDLAQEIISRLKKKSSVVFYDIGCGNGLASNPVNGIFSSIGARLQNTNQDPSLVDKLTYVGIDILPSNVTPDSRTMFVQYDLERIHETIDILPKIDVGVWLWSFPYIEQKLETLETLSKHLNDDGIIIITPFHQDLTVIYQGYCKPLIPCSQVYRDCFETDTRGGSLLVRGHKSPVLQRLAFRKSEVYHTCTNIKGSRFAQMVSQYCEVPRPDVNAA